MSLIAEFEAAPPFGQSAMEQVPSTTLIREETDLTPDGGLRVVCLATGDDLDAFEAALAADEAVAELTTMTAADNRRVYALRLALPGDETAYATLVDCGGQILALEQAVDGVHARVRFPSREAYVVLKEAWERRYGDFRTVGLYTEAGGDGLALTPKQREALAVAIDRGYFDVPRRATLAEVAAELGVSDTATSQRIRRGCRELVRAAAPLADTRGDRGHQNG
jgi:hypothetical protein